MSSGSMGPNKRFFCLYLISRVVPETIRTDDPLMLSRTFTCRLDLMARSVARSRLASTEQPDYVNIFL